MESDNGLGPMLVSKISSQEKELDIEQKRENTLGFMETCMSVTANDYYQLQRARAACFTSTSQILFKHLFWPSLTWNHKEMKNLGTSL